MKNNISFEHNGMIMKITFFNKKNMSVDVDCFDRKDNFIKKSNIVFAQLPKK